MRVGAMNVARWKKIAIRSVLALGALGAALYGANGWVLHVGKGYMTTLEAAEPAEAVMVLGAYVFPDGTVSDMLQDRLETALKVYQSGKAKKILITGDHGRVEYDEVNAMRRYLEEKGVPPEDLFMDHAGFDTYNSAYRAKAIFQVESAIIVTQRFHLPRALYIADRLGIEAQGIEADLHRYQKAEYYEFREMGARIKAFAEVLFHCRPVFLGETIPITGDGRVTNDLPE